jgi:hypothetical protein
MVLLAALPALLSFPLLRAELPIAWSNAREVAGYFQTMAFLEYGLESFFILSPAESYSSLHLHSFLSTPFVAVGYVEGGRLISWTAAIAGSLIVYALIQQFTTDNWPAVIGALLLWMHPLFMRLSYTYMPETLSIALTSGAVLAIFRYRDSKDLRWVAVGWACLILGITNHMWEAIIAGPIVAIFIYDRDYWFAGATSIITILSVGAIYAITELQPTGGSSLSGYGTHAVGIEFLASPTFWIPFDSFHPLYIAVMLTLPISLIATAYWGVIFLRQRDPTSLLLATWLLSALSLPLFLARGYSIHPYYGWAQLAPLCITGGIWAAKIVPALSEWTSIPSRRVIQSVVGGVFGVVVLYAIVFELGLLAGAGIPVVEEATIPAQHETLDFGQETYRDAANEVRESDVYNSDEIVFVGDWGQSSTPPKYVYTKEATKILIYSNVGIPERNIDQTNRGPSFISNTEAAKGIEECEILIIRHGDEIHTEPC